MKELRLQGISTIEAANAFMPAFIAEHNDRFAKLPRNIPAYRRLIGKYLDVYQFPNGRIEIRAAGTSLPYSEFDKLGELDQGQIVENKRLGHECNAGNQVTASSDIPGDAGTHAFLYSNGKMLDLNTP